MFQTCQEVKVLAQKQMDKSMAEIFNEGYQKLLLEPQSIRSSREISREEALLALPVLTIFPE